MPTAISYRLFAMGMAASPVSAESAYTPFVLPQGERILVTPSDNSTDETAEILADASFTSMIQQGIQEMEQGLAIPWETAKRNLGL